MPSKRPHRKSRLGCLQCKQRRIRCFGGPPQCERCCKHRLECEYKQWTFLNRISSTEEVSSDRPTSSNVLTLTLPHPSLANETSQDEDDEKLFQFQCLHPSPSPSSSLSSLSEGWNPAHAAALHYFRTFAATDFKGYLASEFWTSMLYQRSEHRVPVHQALLAISNAHRERVTAFGQPLSGSTVRLYVKAIQLAVEHIQEESKVDEVRATSLYCCAIFYCFELFNKNPRAADIHLDNGLRLLREWHRLSPTWPPSRLSQAARDDFAKLLYTIGRLDLDRMLRSVATISSDHDEKIFTSGLQPPPDHTLDYFELKCRMMLLSRRVTRFIRRYDSIPISEVPAHVLFSRLQLQSMITEMENLLDQRETMHHSTYQNELAALSTLRLYLVTHRVRLLMMFALDQAQRTAVYDEYADVMLRHAKMAWAAFSAHSERAPLLPEPGVLVPIQWLARGVSREESRREALEFIEQYYAIEGVSVFE
ncbi:hypothetical protein PRZ48_010841 [Zasmidium cellare]|uniref:Zn(2)-C6 fungal-type domain-containing protein n=1 Tax=Zasmidium cellare TaxID=395010 RepID=A0ABR0E9T5_ZASCE|nr:hypothetical protein PRZ48_010841 [Zasmidium cellare]